MHWEVFAQYSENPFRNYKKRSVLGGGLRFELSKSGRLGAGLLMKKKLILPEKQRQQIDWAFISIQILRLQKIFPLTQQYIFNLVLKILKMTTKQV